ncbi:MAG: hypothetical protein H6555_05100 [Lewinellaceae bacterium]|nr:hypothetical protein [Lewinellaceae bacterium]
MRNYFLLLVFIGFVFPLGAINPPGKGFAYSSSAGKFSVVFPARYEVQTSEGEEVETTKISVTIDEQTFFASYTVHTVNLTDRDDLLEVSVDSFREQLNGTIQGKSAWKVKKESGLQAVMNLEEQDAKIQYHVLIVGQIQYQLVVVAPSGSFNQKAADAFIKSFKLSK